MILPLCEIIAAGAAVVAILMAGSTHMRVNLGLYTLQTALLAAYTVLQAEIRHEPGLYMVAVAILVLKAFMVPAFLSWIIKHIRIHTNAFSLIPAPLTMHICIVLLGVSYLLVKELPAPILQAHQAVEWLAPTAAISVLLSGLILMLTRRLAISQIVGFLVIENGIYLFILSQTEGVPFVFEMGVLLDVLAGVMIAGILVFRIQKSFEHMDVTQLSELKD